MFANPLTPNLLDYLAFLKGTVGIANPAVLPFESGTASGGSTTALIDGAQNWAANQWVGAACVDATQGVTAVVATNDSTTLTFDPPPLAAPILAGDAYTVMDGQVLSTLQIALDIVNEALSCASPRIYALAVYNLAADRLINFANDQPAQTFFADQRKKYDIFKVSVGVASSTNDQGTSVGILNPEQMRLFTLQDLQTLKTPYGRQYMAFAQTYGTLWGLT